MSFVFFFIILIHRFFFSLIKPATVSHCFFCFCFAPFYVSIYNAKSARKRRKKNRLSEFELNPRQSIASLISSCSACRPYLALNMVQKKKSFFFNCVFVSMFVCLVPYTL